MYENQNGPLSWAAIKKFTHAFKVWEQNHFVSGSDGEMLGLLRQWTVPERGEQEEERSSG